MLTVVRTFTEYKFEFYAHILIGKQKNPHIITYSGNVKIKRKDGRNFLLLDAKNHFLKTKKVALPTKRTVNLKNICNRAIYVNITVRKK